ncbi:ISL3 family transposase [Brevibacillus halotolerans]|uniref:ISL3 family transposase n=1 Tax=Brevibacillus halotolerans TaxID=1507437 RepID=UPI0015EF8CE2|nr:ISL3 family transposase [Brevibacillus halotolerans]MBA4535215.1 ISL3 family transposase [Brevibacillus halotolerans]
MNVLGLEEFNVIEGYDSEQYYKFVVEARNEPYFCTSCGTSAGLDKNENFFKRHDVRRRTVSDVDLRGKKVIIEILQRRFKCPKCGDNFTEYFESIARNDKVTQRLFKRMGEDSIKGKNTFKSVAEQHGVSDTTVKRAFWSHVDELYRNRVLLAPRVLGIDEVYLHEEGFDRKQPFAVFTDIENKEIIEFVQGSSKEIVIEVIKSMKGYENIEAVTMDMNSGYRHAVMETMPKANCVVDHFHVIQKANMKLNEIRATIQNKLPEGDKKELFKQRGRITANREDLTEEALFKLDEVLEKYPKLQTAYQIKEGLRNVYKQKTKHDAFQQYYKWECSIPKDAKEMKSIQRMINRLKQEVFRYFDGRYTNAYTESFNNVIKRIVRLGVGYSYDVLRAKILFGTKATEIKKVKDMNFHRIFNVLSRISGEVIWIHPNSEYAETYSYRVGIDKLLQQIEDGEF